jgi:CRISPR-associated protein Cas2
MSKGAKRDQTCYIVAYDIPDDRRRTRVHKVLSGFGRWTQFSLFECHLTARQVILLHSKLDKYLDAKKDSVRFYPLCEACMAKVETIGGEPPTDDLLFMP